MPAARNIPNATSAVMQRYLVIVMMLVIGLSHNTAESLISRLRLRAFVTVILRQKVVSDDTFTPSLAAVMLVTEARQSR